MTEHPPSGPTGDPDLPPSAPQHGQQPQYGQQPPQYGNPGYTGPGGTGEVPGSDRRLWAMLSHLGGIVLGFIAPLIVWAMYKDRDEFLKDQSTEALNFQITVVIAILAAWVLTVISFGILFFLPFLVWVGNVIMCVLGGVAANREERYRYPFSLRLVK